MAVEAVIFQQIVDINWDQAIYTASPNDTVNVAQFAAKGSGTNIGIALTPKGTGYISAHVPNGAASGGNARGTHSVDWQTLRANASQVASAGASCIVGGQNNTASGIYSFAGGQSCTASALHAFAYGIGATASGSQAVAIGSNVVASSPNSLATGRDTQTSVRSMRSHGFGSGTQRVCFCLVGKTTTNSLVELLIPITSERFVLSVDTAMSGQLEIIGTKTDGTAFARYTRQVSIRRTGSTTSLFGSVETIGVDEAAGTSIAITANDVNESLKVEAAGVASENWAWAAVFAGVIKAMTY
jgi:hypothetical protein